MWIYEHETRDDAGEGNGRLEVHRWKTEETIVGSWNVPEGTLVGIQVRVLEGAPPLRIRADRDLAFLIRGNCLYILRAYEGSTHQLTSEDRKSLGAGEISADFCFPLIVHKTWGAPNWGRPASEAKDWKVVRVKNSDQSIPNKQNTVPVTSISSYLGSGMTADIWFEKGVGIVREDEIHHGTVGEERTHLLNFQPVL